MAHQMNLVVGDIFKESLQYRQVSKNAVRIVSYFHSSSYFMGLLRNEQNSCYGQTIALITPGETRWNNFYYCFHSILKTELALKVKIFILAKHMIFDDHSLNYYTARHAFLTNLLFKR